MAHAPYGQRNGLAIHFAAIDGRFGATSKAPFEQPYMRALFAHRERLGRDARKNSQPRLLRRRGLGQTPKREIRPTQVRTLPRSSRMTGRGSRPTPATIWSRQYRHGMALPSSRTTIRRGNFGRMLVISSHGATLRPYEGAAAMPKGNREAKKPK